MNKPQSMKKQAALLTTANVLVRGLGFVFRIWLSRLMGAEAMGLMELSGSVHMLSITPLTAGIPLAVSRLTGKARAGGQLIPLVAARRLIRRMLWLFVPAYLLLSPLIARLLGDARTLPALWAGLPCLLILGYSAAYNGYCYGVGNAYPPAISELAEQVLRIGLSMGLLMLLPQLTVPWMAAVPTFATGVAEAVGLLMVILLLRLPMKGLAPEKADVARVGRQALPHTVIRFLSVGMRSVNAAMIPRLLQGSGLPAAEATARLGMFSGMVLPLLMLPSMATGALAMLAAPAAAKREEKPGELTRLFVTLLMMTLVICAVSALVLYYAAPWIAVRLYRQNEIAPLVRLMLPSVALMGLHQVASGLVAGVNRQRQLLYASIGGAGVTLALNLLLTGTPLRLEGAAYASMAGQAVTLAGDGIILVTYLRGRMKRTPAGDISA